MRRPSRPLTPLMNRDTGERRAPPEVAGPLDARRAFLRRAGAGLGAAALVGGGLPLAARAALPTERRLSLVNAHTWERLDVVYFTHGMYIDESLAAVSHLMRDHRAGEERLMDPRLLDDLVRLHASLETEEPLHLLSGYRTPATNAKLRMRSKGVAKYSLHMEGRAADIYVPGVPTEELQRAALDMRAGGVGYYKSSNFVHIDTGEVRHWERG